MFVAVDADGAVHDGREESESALFLLRATFITYATARQKEPHTYVIHRFLPMRLLNQSCIIFGSLYGKTSYPRNGNFITVPGVFLTTTVKKLPFLGFVYNLY